MRIVLRTAILASAMIAAAPAVAQNGYPQRIPAPMGMHGMAPQMRTGGPVYQGAPQVRQQHANRTQHGGGQRWGGMINGRWHGGMQAPGGWGAYHRPSRGFQLDRYWMANDFQIPDYDAFGLGAPPAGYFWVRYYDDAVLVDSYGRVRDSVSGIAWADASADAGYGYAAASSAASSGAGYSAPIANVDPNGAYYEDDSGYGDAYSEPQGGYAPPVVAGPPAVHVRCSGGCQQQQQGYGYGSQGYSGGGYAEGGYAGGYYGGGATTTTIVIQVPTVTTTTTTTEEVIDEGSSSYETVYVSRPRSKLVRRSAPARYPTKRLRRTGCGC